MEGYPRPKRVLGVAVALVLVVLLSPVFALVYVAMALDMILSRIDRGSWLFRERRISRGREFDLLTFRTLRRSSTRPPGGRRTLASTSTSQRTSPWRDGGC